MKSAPALLVLTLLTGCTAHMVTHESKYAPLNEQNGGQIKYLAAGAPPVQRARREDAYKQMYQRCNGSYRIVAESDTPAGSYSFGQASAYGNHASGSSFTTTGSWRYINFECVPREAAQANAEGRQ